MIQKDNSKRAALSQEAQELRSFHSDDAPIGEDIVVTLNGKSWGRSTNLLCYFTDSKTGSNFTISVFRSREDGETYGVGAGSVDFSEPNIVGNTYKLEIQKSPRSKFPSLKSAVEITK